MFVTARRARAKQNGNTKQRFQGLRDELKKIAMPSIYRYFTQEQHALDFMAKGLVFLNTLAFFRRCEGDDARGDPHDA